MQDFFSSGLAVDVVLAVLVLEFFALVGLARRNAGAMLDAALALAPGACLLLALRAALGGDDWRAVALWLALSFPFHLADLLRRRQRWLK